MSSTTSSTISQEVLSALTERLADAFKPVPRRLLWQWAETDVVLSPKTGTFSPGKYRTRHTPHVREVMEAFQSDDVREIVLKFAAQTSKTLTETICTAWAIQNDPGNMLFVMPSEQMAKSFSKSRLQQVIEDSPSVRRHVMGRRGSFNVLEMELDNCIIALAGAGSASNLASRPIRYLFLDEVDKYPRNLGDEGSPVELAKERTKTFPNCKIMESSTPTTDSGEVSVQYESSDKREWFVPCPECGHEFVVRWDTISFPEEGTDDERAEACGCRCPKCGHVVPHAKRREFLSAGHWRATCASSSGAVGFHIAEMASCIGRPWPALVKMFLSATRKSRFGNHEDLKTFVCSVLAEGWKQDNSSRRDRGQMLRHCSGYRRGTVPTYVDIAGLTAGIDTQDNGFYWVIRAWGGGESMESFLVDNGFAEDLSELEYAVTRSYPSDDGLLDFGVDGGFMDAMGHRTQEVYKWCRTVGRSVRIVPIKGEQTMSNGTPLSFAPIAKDGRGRPIPGGQKLCHVNTTLYKDWLNGKLDIPMDDYGAWHLYDGVDDDYCDMMVSEARDEEGVWSPVKDGIPNHYWDCETYALASADNLKLDRRGRRRKASEEESVVVDMDNGGMRQRRY